MSEREIPIPSRDLPSPYGFVTDEKEPLYIGTLGQDFVPVFVRDRLLSAWYLIRDKDTGEPIELVIGSREEKDIRRLPGFVPAD